MKPMPWILVATLVSTVALPLLAEEAPSQGSAVGEATEPCRLCRSWWTLTYGGGWGVPQGRYASFGLILGDVRYVGPAVGMGAFRAAVLQADVGRGAWSVSMGTPTPLLVKVPRNWEPLGVPLAGVVGKLTLLHTSGHPTGAPSDQTYLGGVVEIVALVHLRLGVLAHVSGGGPRKPLWIWGIGPGL